MQYNYTDEILHEVLLQPPAVAGVGWCFLTAVVNVICVAFSIFLVFAVVKVTTRHDEVTGTSDDAVLCRQEVNEPITTIKHRK